MASKKVEETKTDAIEHVTVGALATEMPDFLKEFKGQNLGSELVENSDLVMPRVALCQDLTPQRKKQDPKYIPGLDVGMYFNTMTGEIYGDKIYFVPVKFSKSQMLCKPMNEGGGIICQSLNGKTGGKLSDNCETCEKNSWANGKPECGKLQNFLGFIFDHPPVPGDAPEDSAVLTFKSTGLKIGKQLNSLIRVANVPAFARVYEISAVSETRNNNTYYTHKLRPVGFVSQDLFSAGKNLYEIMKDRDIAVDEGAAHDDTGGDSSFEQGKDF